MLIVFLLLATVVDIVVPALIGFHFGTSPESIAWITSIAAFVFFAVTHLLTRRWYREMGIL